MSKLALESVIVWTEFGKKSLIILTVNHLFLRNFSGLKTLVELSARPDHQVSSRGQCWSPAFLEKWIVFGLQGFLHLKLIIDGGHIVVESAVLHESLPHQSVVLIIAGDRESASWLVLFGGGHSLELHSLNEGFALKGLLLGHLSLNLGSELLVEKDVLSILLKLFTVLFSVEHIYY